MKKYYPIYILLLVVINACQSGISFEQIEYKKEFPLKEGKDSPKFYYSANILWAKGGTPELNKWLLNSAGIPYAKSKNAVKDSINMYVERENADYVEYNIDMDDSTPSFQMSWSIDNYCSITYQCPEYISIIGGIDRYTGGAHNMVSNTKRSWLLQEHRVITFDDIFKRGKEDVIRPKLMRELMLSWDFISFKEVNKVLDYKPLPILDFALAKDSIDFFYPYYTIAPRAYGEPTLRIAAKEIAPALTDFGKKLLHVNEPTP